MLFPYKAVCLGNASFAISFNGEFHPSINKLCLLGDYDCIAFILICNIEGFFEPATIRQRTFFEDWAKDKTRLKAPYNPAFKKCDVPFAYLNL